MIKKIAVQVILSIALIVVTYLYFTKPVKIFNTDQVEINRLNDSINKLKSAYSFLLEKESDSLVDLIERKDSVIRIKNANYWNLKKEHEKTIISIMAMPDDSIVILFSRLTIQ